MEGNIVHVLIGEGLGIGIVDVSFDYLKNPDPLVLTYNHAYGDATGAQELQFDEITNRKIRDRVIQMVQTINGDPRMAGQAQASGIQPHQDVIQNVQQ